MEKVKVEVRPKISGKVGGFEKFLLRKKKKNVDATFLLQTVSISRTIMQDEL
jgi:hypothetical protein